MSSNPLVVLIPYTFAHPEDYPTEVLAERFQGWRQIIKDLVAYLKEFVLVQDEIIRQQKRLQQVVGQPPTDGEDPRGFFLPALNGSIIALPLLFSRFHEQNITNGQKTYKELQNVIIPKLEELRHDLLMKIKEIKGLQNDFRTNLARELSETKTCLQQFNHAVSSSAPEHATSDPYLVRNRLNRQLKKQIHEENYLYQAYANLQTLGGKLEEIIVREVQHYLQMFVQLLTAEAQGVTEYLAPNLIHGFLAKEPTFEWDSFILRNLPHQLTISHAVLGKFIDLAFPQRKLLELQVPHHDDAVALAIREGWLERRSKYLKLYLLAWFVLTCNFIHEFKTKDRKKDPNPVNSLLLDLCLVTEHLKEGTTGPFKFILVHKALLGIIHHKTTNFVFRTLTYQEMIDWYKDIATLTKLPNPSARARYLEKNQRPAARLLLILLGASLVQLPPPRPLSQATLAAPRRLLLTFSHKNSPRLLNMINLDGTAITPVDTPTPESSVPTQQFYDPVQQQYYTITPVAPPKGAPVAPVPVQPQYFTGVPLGAVSPQLVPVGRPGLPLYIFPTYIPAQQPVLESRKSVLTLQTHPEDTITSDDQEKVHDGDIQIGV